MNEQFWWYLTRSSGIIAWLMLTLAVIWGILLSTKAFPEQRRPIWLLSLHRWLGGLTMCFLAIHLVALVADSYVSFGLADIAVPFASEWQPGAVAFGVVAAWLLVAVQLTSAAMKRLPRKVWRGIHLSSYLAFWLGSLHGAYAGTDATTWMYRAGAVASILAVAWALMYRLANRRSVRRAARPTGESNVGRSDRQTSTL